MDKPKTRYEELVVHAKERLHTGQILYLAPLDAPGIKTEDIHLIKGSISELPEEGPEMCHRLGDMRRKGTLSWHSQAGMRLPFLGLGASQSTGNIFKSWCRMLGGQIFLLLMNAWCLRLFTSMVGAFLANPLSL